MATHSSVLAWTRGAWQATVRGLTKSRTQLSNQHTHTHMCAHTHTCTHTYVHTHTQGQKVNE